LFQPTPPSFGRHSLVVFVSPPFIIIPSKERRQPNMMNIPFYSFLLIASASASGHDPLNMAEECPRIRRPWHTLSQNERDTYISGIMQIRANGLGDIGSDEFIAIASVHEDEFAPVTHKASSYLFWHGYITYELETRIRSLGGVYSCFGMPYWDFTMEAGREQDPTIFDTGLGGAGDMDDFYTVNGYSWQYTTDDFWVPFNCYAQNDAFPICSLKRAMRARFAMPTAQEIGRGIMENPHFTQFAKWYATNYNPVHLFTDAPFLESPSPVTTSYDPIWYLFHSMVQYHQAIWTDCNEYDLIDPAELEQHPFAYSPYCVHGECISPNKYPVEWMGMELDDVMHFGGDLEAREWSYIHNNELTVRKLYHLPRWGIVYDLGKEDGFYEQSGMREYCEGKLNNRWFITDVDNPYKSDGESEKVMMAESYIFSSYITYHSVSVIVLVLIGAIVYGLYQIAMKKNKMEATNYGNYSYGAVYA